jgi:hypothetical protein
MNTFINLPAGRQVNSSTGARKLAFFTNFKNSKRIRWAESRYSSTEQFTLAR